MFCKYTDVKVMRGLEAGSVLVVYIILSFFGQLFAFMEPAKQPCTFTNKQKNCLRTRLVNIKTKTESRLKKNLGSGTISTSPKSWMANTQQSTKY